jgi:hypothetical protein
MATSTGKPQCVTCNKEKRTAVKCECCQQIFCLDHLSHHRQELAQQLDDIEANRDLFRQTLNEQRNDSQKGFFIKPIDEWEKDPIEKIQQIAKQCRQILIQYTTGHFNQIEIDLTKFTDQLREIRQENDFNEINLNQLKHKLTQLSEELNKPPNVLIQQDPASVVNKISVVTSSGNYDNYI